MMQGNTAEGRAALKAGDFDPLPIKGKRPVVPQWPRGPITAERLADWEKMAAGQADGTGLRTGRLVSVDIDAADAGHVAELRAVVEGVFGPTDFEREGNKGIHLVYRQAEHPLSKITVSGHLGDRKGGLVEILGAGNQMAAYGKHPETGRPFTWPKRDPLSAKFEDLPAVSRDQVRQLAADLRDRLEELGADGLRITGDLADRPANGLDSTPAAADPVRVEDFVEMFRHVDPGEVERDPDWIRFLGIIADAPLVNADGTEVDDFDREGFADEWSSGRLGGFEPANYRGEGDVAAAFGSLHGGQDGAGGLGSLIFAAREAGYDGPTRYVSAEELAAQRPSGLVEEYFGKVEATSSEVDGEVDAPDGFFWPMSGAELVAGNWPEADHLWSDLVLADHVNTLDGDGGVGKSLLLIQLAVAVAAGRPLFGRPTIQRPALLLLAEDDRGETRKRFLAACAALDVNPAEVEVDFLCSEDLPNPILAEIEDNGAERITEFHGHLGRILAAKGRPVLLGLDTVSDIAIMDENKRLPHNTLSKRVLAPWTREFGSTVVFDPAPLEGLSGRREPL